MAEELTIVLKHAPDTTVMALWEEIEKYRDRRRGIHDALGAFMHFFSIVEWKLNTLIAHYAKISRVKLNILLGPQRVDNGISILNRLKNAGRVPTPQIPELEELTKQLASINRFRNDVIHYGFYKELPDGSYKASGNYYKYPGKKFPEHIVSPKILGLVEVDLAMITERINLLMFPDRRMDDVHAKVLREPWRYIPQ